MQHPITVIKFYTTCTTANDKNCANTGLNGMTVCEGFRMQTNSTSPSCDFLRIFALLSLVYISPCETLEPENNVHMKNDCTSQMRIVAKYLCDVMNAFCL
jgi:hypothetical protein